jgi:hypothetical protein
MHKGHTTQVEKYGGEEGYREEMKRRRSLLKNQVGGFKDPERARIAALKSAEVRRNNARNKSK